MKWHRHDQWPRHAHREVTADRLIVNGGGVLAGAVP
jgi:hypothetical protein